MISLVPQNLRILNPLEDLLIKRQQTINQALKAFCLGHGIHDLPFPVQ